MGWTLRIAWLPFLLAAAPAFGGVDGGAYPTLNPTDPIDRLQLRRCADRKNVTWSPNDGTPAPLSDVECYELMARLVCDLAVTAGPDGERAVGVLKALERTMAPDVARELANLAPFEDLTQQREAVDIMRSMLRIEECGVAGLPPATAARAPAIMARARAWLESTTKTLDAEQDARDSTVGPICQAQALAEEARAGIARERSNPAGVVDLTLLHQLGDDLRTYQEQVAALRPAYAAVRHRAFDGRGEGMCDAARRERGLR